MFEQNMTSFRNLIAWQKAKALIIKIYHILRIFPKDELYGLTSQIKRASISIASNIAEGNQRRTTPDRLRFFNIAQGSLIELDCQLDIALELKFINIMDYRDTLESVNKAAYFLTKLIQSEINPKNPKNHKHHTNPNPNTYE